MAALENKIDFAIAFEVNNANPNGDPLNGNRPRTTSEGLHGFLRRRGNAYHHERPV